MHWPEPARGEPERWRGVNLQTWRALEELYAKGRVKSIGVSNFLPHHLEPLLAEAQVRPAANQIEFHPGFMQKGALDFCVENGILVEAWSPLGSGKLLENDALARIAHKYSRSPAQICLRWCLQHGTLPLPKSVTEARMAENARIFDFEIAEGDMSIIDAMPYSGGSGLDPDKIDF